MALFILGKTSSGSGTPGSGGGGSGGGSGSTANLTIKNVNENGTYLASEDGADGYSKVNVNVVPNVIEKDITDNGIYLASSDNVDGYNSLNVDVVKDRNLIELLRYGHRCGELQITDTYRIEIYAWYTRRQVKGLTGNSNSFSLNTKVCSVDYNYSNGESYYGNKTISFDYYFIRNIEGYTVLYKDDKILWAVNNDNRYMSSINGYTLYSRNTDSNHTYYAFYNKVDYEVDWSTLTPFEGISLEYSESDNISHSTVGGSVSPGTNWTYTNPATVTWIKKEYFPVTNGYGQHELAGPYITSQETVNLQGSTNIIPTTSAPVFTDLSSADFYKEYMEYTIAVCNRYTQSGCTFVMPTLVNDFNEEVFDE